MTPRRRSLRPLLVLTAGIGAALLTRPATTSPAPAPQNPTTRSFRPAVRDANTLPGLDALRQAQHFASSIFAHTDSFPLVSHGFQDLDGTCQSRGWKAEDRTTQVFAHAQSGYVVNQPAFAGLAPDPALGPDNLTGQTSTTRLHGPRAIALDDLGRLIYNDDGSTPRFFVATPGSDLTASYGLASDPGAFASAAAFDPSTNSVVVSVANRGWLVRYDGSGSEQFVGGNPSGVPDDSTIAEASLGSPRQLAVDALGDVYFADPITQRVRMLRADGRVVTIAGVMNSPGFSGDDGPATAAQLNGPRGLAFDSSGNLYISDTGNNRVRKVDPASGIITTVTGDGTPGVLPSPRTLAASGSDLFIASADRIYKLSGGSLTLAAGGGGVFGPAAGAGSPTRLVLADPEGLTSDGAGGLYFGDPDLRLVLHLDAGGALSVAAGVPIGIAMGSKALWFGADASSAPEEVAGWVRPSGYGNFWSQRLTSPSFSAVLHPDAELTFDAVVELEDTTGLGSPFLDNEFVIVQGLSATGTWERLGIRVTSIDGCTSCVYQILKGYRMLKAEVPLGLGGGASLAEPMQFRIVFQTNTARSPEDGLNTDGASSGLILDNLRIVEGGADLVPAVDFEDGGTGGWTPSALNGAYAPIPDAINYTRDVPPPQTDAVLQSSFDFNDPSCVWTFLSQGNVALHDGTLARITSPWFALPQRDSTVYISFSGKLSPAQQDRFLNVMVREKDAGDVQPRRVSVCNFLLAGPPAGGDAAVPFTNQRVLRFPQDFQSTQPADSGQLVFQIEDRAEEFNSGTLPSRPPTALPFLDDIRLLQFHVDQDFDGVADVSDACPGASAAGQDADGNGCLEPTATMRHVESWSRDDALRYRISEAGSAKIPDTSDMDAVASAFAAWQGVPGASLVVTRDPDTPQLDASATDGINLVTFQDPDFVFPSNVLAVALTTSLTRRAAYGDRIALPGQIVDADILVNPNAKIGTPTTPSDFDLQSVLTHEAGHVLGLTHSGVSTATMFFVLPKGTPASSLEDDDRAAIAAAYPGSTLLTDYAAIKGMVTRGGTGEPVPGALVTAVHLDGGGAVLDSTSSDYTAEDGSYALYRLAPGSYAVRVTPLDGDVGGYPLTASFVSERLKASAESNFQAEWWSIPESDRDDPSLMGILALAASDVTSGINVITNVDTIPPMVVSVSPDSDATGVHIDSAILLGFSEPIDDATLGAALRVHADGSPDRLAGVAHLVNGSRAVIFTPSHPLDFETLYDVDVTTALTDRRGVPLAALATSQFTTETQPPVAIADVQPRQAPVNALLTISGAGFDASVPGNNQVEFAGPGGPLQTAPASVTPTSMVVRVPAGAITGSVQVTVATAGDPLISNPFQFAVVAPTPQSSPALSGLPIALTFQPSDCALAPDGLTAYAVGGGGLATVNLDPGRPDFRAAVAHSIGAASRIALTPDGARAIVTRPVAGDAVVVDADPLSGTFGQAVTNIPVAGTPEGIALSPGGRRAYLTDQLIGKAFELDIDPGSATFNSVLREIRLPGALLTAGIGVTPDNTQLLVTTSNAGSRAIEIANDSMVVLLHPGASTGGASATLGGDQALFAGTGGQVLFSSLPGGTSSSLALGGSLADLAMSVQGQSAFVVNAQLGLLQVIDVDPASPTFHTKVAEVATGSAPRAVAVSANGTLLGVVNAGDRTLSLYSLAGGLGLGRVVPDIASPGDAIAIESGGAGFTAGAEVEIPPSSTPTSFIAGTSFGFVVPPFSQRTTSLSLSQGSTRSLELPFRIVDPVQSKSPRVTGLVLGPTPVDCSGGPQVGLLEQVQTSPDGRLLALTRNFGGSCPSLIDLYQVSDDALRGFAAYDSTVSVNMGDLIAGVAFAPDSRTLWAVTQPTPLIKIVDVDRSSPTFAGVISTLTPGGLAQLHSVLADPLGRYMYVGVSGPGAVQRYAPSGTLVDALTLGPTQSANALATTPDGRFLIAGGVGQAFFFDAVGGTLIGASPLHAADVGAVAVTSNGKRGVGQFSDGNLAVWNLDPSAGTVGTELFFGTVGAPVVFPNAHMWTSSSWGNGVGYFGCATCDSLVALDLAVIPPAVTYTDIGQHSRALGRSADGRQLWVTQNAGGSAVSGDLRLLALNDGTSMALVTGGGLSALAGTPLPLPVRVRVVGGTGRPIEGVVIQFDLGSAANGTIDGAPGGVKALHLTDTNGEARVGWTMPGTIGTASMTITRLDFPAAPLVVTAEVAGDDNLIAPVVVDRGPADGAVNVNAGTPVFVRFNQHMDPASVSGKIHLMANGAPVAGSFSFNDGDRFVLFQPSALLPFGANGSLEVEAGALDQEGQALATGSSSTFTVQPMPALALSALSPLAGPVGATLVLVGQGFNPTPAQNSVFFNALPATVSEATLTSLVVTVPAGAVSGPVKAQVGATFSNTIGFTVLARAASAGSAVASVSAGQGISDVAVTPDGQRAYVTNPSSNSVTALDLVSLTPITGITVGLEPQSVAILADGSRAYVANTGSNNVSVIDINPASPSYHQVVNTIAVGDQPIDVAASAFGNAVVVANFGGTLSIIDAQPGNGSADQVIATTNTGGVSKGVAISPDGANAYVATSEGVVIVDLGTHAVVTTVNSGGGTKSIAISPDGALLVALTDDNTLIVIDLSPGADQYKVVASTNTGGTNKGIAISADGGLAYVVSAEGNTVQIYQISGGGQPSTFIPGPKVTLALIETITVGALPSGLTTLADAAGRPLALVGSLSTGELSLIGFTSALVPVTVNFEFEPNTLNLKSMGKWVKGEIGPPPPLTPEQIVIPSILLNGVVPVDPAAPHEIEHEEGESELVVRFLRSAVVAILPVGEKVPVFVTGTIDGRPFIGRDSIKVKNAKVQAPEEDDVVEARQPYTVEWETPDSTVVQYVALLHSCDRGESWQLDATGLPNTGQCVWTVPDTLLDSARVAVVLVESEGPVPGEVTGVLGVSDPFRIISPTATGIAPVPLALGRIHPNPGSGAMQVQFGLPTRMRARLDVFDLQGRRVRTLLNGEHEAGWHQAVWKGQNDAGARVGAGVYFVRFEAGGRKFQQRVVWLR